eukprot:m51a1_g65 hypothetical protein (331) ;mRNA; f:215415-216407
MSTAGGQEGQEAAVLEARSLTFTYDASCCPVLNNVSLALPRGSRCVVVGANGAGKSTLLRVFAGRHSPDSPGCSGDARVLGRHAFRDTTLNRSRALLDAAWAVRTLAFAAAGVPYSADVRVGDMMRSLQDEFPQRRDELRALLGINPGWAWNMLSEGQRRRVQLFVGLLVPADVVLLDEVTALLDILCRRDLLAWLRLESERRGACVVIATHVLDGLSEWATHILNLRAPESAARRHSSVAYFGTTEKAPGLAALRSRGVPEPLHAAVVQWLEEEREQCKGTETEAGEDALASGALSESTKLAGGYAPGRASLAAPSLTLSSSRNHNYSH